MELNKDGFLLLTPTNNQHLWINRVNGLESLAFPARDTSHVSIRRALLREFLEALSNSMHGVNSPAILSEDRIDDSRTKDNLSLKGHNKLKIREVRIWAIHRRRRLEEVEISSLGLR